MARYTLFTKKNGWAREADLNSWADTAYSQWVIARLKEYQSLPEKFEFNFPSIFLTPNTARQNHAGSIENIRITSQKNDRQTDDTTSAHKLGYAVDVAIEPCYCMLSFASWLHDKFPVDIFFGTYRVEGGKTTTNRHLHIERRPEYPTGGFLGIECITKTGATDIASVYENNFSDLVDLYGGSDRIYRESFLRPSMIGSTESVRYRRNIKPIRFNDYGLQLHDIKDAVSDTVDSLSNIPAGAPSGALTGLIVCVSLIAAGYIGYQVIKGSDKKKKSKDQETTDKNQNKRNPNKQIA